MQPFVALGKGLQAAGHDVVLVSHKIFASFIREHGLGFCPLEINPRQVLINQSVAEFGNNTLQITRWVHENFKPVLADIFQATLEAAHGADALLNSVFSFAGWHVAEKLNNPAIAAYWCPVTSSRHPPPSTAAAGLQAGVPNVIMPFFGDQAFGVGLCTSWELDQDGYPAQHWPSKNWLQLSSKPLAIKTCDAAPVKWAPASRQKTGLKPQWIISNSFPRYKRGYEQESR